MKPSANTKALHREPSITAPLLLGLALVCGLFGGLMAWAASASVSGAVVAGGQVVVESNVKKVQHPTGGIVGEVRVRNGDLVRAGDVVIRLDETQTRANLGVVVSQLVQLIGRRARLETEQSGSSELSFPDDFNDYGPDAETIAEGERKLFLARTTARRGQTEQLTARIEQSKEEIEGLLAQQKSKDEEIKLMREELGRVSELHKKNLLPTTRLLSVERDMVRLRGEWGVLTSQVARLRGQISEIELQIIGIDQTTRSDAGRELREIEARIAELTERRAAAEDQLRRVDLRAPQAGVVHELSVHTVGGVVGPGETLMQIVPLDDKLVVDVKIAPMDIDQVIAGQKTILRFTAFNQRTTPEIPGRVQRVGADLTREPQTNAAYYVARIQIAEQDLSKLRDAQKLVPGMPVEAYIETESRTVLSYLLKPLTDQFLRALREA